MSLGGFTLADRLGAKPVACRVPGCTRTWMSFSNKALALPGVKGAETEDPETAGMCDPCRTKSKGLKDVERRCERQGCAGTWTWKAAAQLEAFATRRPAPRNFCADCETKLAGLSNKEIPCVIPGCTRHAVLSPKAQLLAETPVAAPADQVGEQKSDKTEPRHGVTFEGTMCSDCERIAQKLKDRQVNCGINGCNRKWTFKADEQIQFFAAGRTSDPPRRMCDECRAGFGKLLDRDVRCRTSGCKKTWVWSRSDQLDACVAGKPAPKAQQRMCQSCFDFFQGTKDLERPCRKSTCKGTWTDKRGAQLARAVRGKTGEPYPRYCGTCEKELGHLDDREVACKTDGCGGTFTWTKEQQLAAGVVPKLIEVPGESEAKADGASAEAANANGHEEAAAPDSTEAAQPGKKKNKKKRRREPRPPERRCSACAEFLAERKTQEIPCGQCATPIYWPPESQLQTHLGNWAAPGMCGACKRDATEAARLAAKQVLREQAMSVHGTPAEPAQAAPGEPTPSSESTS